jgi:uncharacterized membrane protein
MDEVFLRNTGIFSHIIGIVFLAGGLLGTLMLDRWFWSIFESEPAKAQTLAEASRKLSLLTQIGSGLMFLSGFILLFVSRFSTLGQLWLIIKLILFVLMAVVGAVIGARTGRQLRSLMPQWITANAKVSVAPGGTTAPLNTAKEQVHTDLTKVKSLQLVYHLSLNIMFALAIFLGVYKIG